jgi:SPP1 gp7 family putative phage head morphogenesis protein
LKDEHGKLREFADFKEAADGIIDKYNETWLKTEYNFAVSASQSAARWTEFEQEADIIPNLKYQTVGDDHVRASHQVLDGIIRPLEDSFWDTHYPPNGYGCRCEAVRSLEGYGNVTPDKNIPVVPIPDMFKTNLAKTGLIYPKNHPYYLGVPRSEISKALAYLPPKNTFIDVDFGNDVVLDIHPLHGDKELSANIDLSRLLKRFEPKAEIKLMPIISENDMNARKLFYPESYLNKYPTRNADILYNGKAFEFENANGSRSSIQNAIKNGKKQAENIVIRIPDSIDINQADQIVKGQLKHYQDKEDLQVWLVNSSKKLKYKTNKSSNNRS